MISGIKRKSTAVEGTRRYFQTVNLIISHLKREADKEKIFEIIDKDDSTLKELLIATAAIHIYHNLGIRVKDSLDLSEISSQSTHAIEVFEKKTLFKEVESLLKDSLGLEIMMLNNMIDMENWFLQFSLDERQIKMQEFEKKRKLQEINSQIEQNLMDVIINYPSFYFYDLIGELIGLSDDLRIRILKEESALKDLSVEIEKKMEREEKRDITIELSTLDDLIDEIKKRFEFRSYKELQVQAMPVRMIKKDIIDNRLNRSPISISGLNEYLNANETKKRIINLISEALSKKIRYEKFENDIIIILKKEFVEKLRSNPNDFVYFLQNLNESNFNEIIYQLNKNGIYNILDIIDVDEELASKIKKYMIRYNIDKYDFISLNDDQKNILLNVKKFMCKIKSPSMGKDAGRCIIEDEIDIEGLLRSDPTEFEEVWKQLEKNLDMERNEIREKIRKSEIIDKYFIRELNLNSYSQILTILEFDKIITNLVKETYYYLFSKILKQLSRIIETYYKISNEKSLYLLVLKKISGTTETEEWVRIKLEELLIKRLMNRQKELVIAFNADNKPFEVNGFIYSRLTDLSLEEAISELRNEPSPLYEEVKSLTLPEEIISPISYCLAFDLVKRFQTSENLRKLRIEEKIESKQREKEKKKEELRKHQEKSTLNWIERRITSSLMRINSPGINPNQLYWKEKDTKVVTENLKLHSELEGNPVDLVNDYFIFAIQKMKEFIPEMRFPDLEKLRGLVKNITEKVLETRLNHTPDEQEIKSMLEGERFDIAKNIAKRIGNFLDKALYTKFKKKNRNG